MGFRRLITLLTIFGSIASLIALLIYFLPKERISNLDIICYSVEDLTNYDNDKEPDFQTHYTYKEQPINRLWKLDVEFLNSSAKTFVGKGKLQNTLVDTLAIVVSEGYEIIDKKIIQSDFEHWLNIGAYDTILLNFSQWREDESFRYSFYVKSDSLISMPNIIFSTPKERQLLDAEIRFFDKTEDLEQNEKKLITDYLPIKLKKAIYIICIVFLGIFIIVFFIMAIANIIGYTRRRSWKRLFYPDFRDFIEEKYSTDQNSIDKYINHPEKVTDWDGFPYPYNTYPKDLDMDFGNKDFESFILTVFFLFLFSLSMAVIFIDLVQLLP